MIFSSTTQEPHNVEQEGNLLKPFFLFQTSSEIEQKTTSSVVTQTYMSTRDRNFARKALS